MYPHRATNLLAILALLLQHYQLLIPVVCARAVRNLHRHRIFESKQSKKARPSGAPTTRASDDINDPFLGNAEVESDAPTDVPSRSPVSTNVSHASKANKGKGKLFVDGPSSSPTTGSNSPPVSKISNNDHSKGNKGNVSAKSPFKEFSPSASSTTTSPADAMPRMPIFRPKPKGGKKANSRGPKTLKLPKGKGKAASKASKASSRPSAQPSVSDMPSSHPSAQPSSMPSSQPSSRPSDLPSLSDSPSHRPSTSPSLSGEPTSDSLSISMSMASSISISISLSHSYAGNPASFSYAAISMSLPTGPVAGKSSKAKSSKSKSSKSKGSKFA